MNTVELETLLPWSAPKRVDTKFGARILRKASPNEQFSSLWKAGKERLKSAGIGWSQDKRTGQWEVCWWTPLPKEEIEAQSKAVEASKAVDAHIDIPCPPGLAYRPFQRAGMAFSIKSIKRCGGALIADDMGVGKTIQAIGIINAMEDIHRVLIIGPKNVTVNWKHELQRWLTRPMTIGVADSKCIPSADIVVINYDIVHKHQKALSYYWDLVIMDECHYVKNPNSRRAISILGKKCTKKELEAGEQSKSGIPCKRRLALTGTPICNRPREIFPIINWIAPQDWPNVFKFLLRYCNGHQNGFGWDFSGTSNLEELQTKLRSTIMVRRLKSEVLTELPPKTRQIVEIEDDNADELIREEYDIQEKLGALAVEEELAKASGNESEYNAAVARMKEAKKASFEDAARIAHEIALIKVPHVIEHVKDLLDNYPDKKVILFGHHLDAIAQYVAEFPGSVSITGQTSAEARYAVIHKFQTDPTCRLFVGGIRAANMGITLTRSDHVVFSELDWVPGIMCQAEDRAYRIGQANAVLVEHMLLKGSMDVRKAKVLIQKQEIIEKALDRSVKIEEPKDAITSITIDVGSAIDIVRLDPAKMEQQAAQLTAEQIRACHSGLRLLANVCNGAISWDGAGFSKWDTALGKSLARQECLSSKQGLLAKKLVNKYRRQLPDALLKQCGIDWTHEKED